jgi:ribonuclease P protein component
MRFRPEQHLRRQSDIRIVREKGARLDCGVFTLWWLAREPQQGDLICSGPRVCVIASTAAVGNAVQRARAKRRLRELFRKHQDKIDPRLDLMLLSRRAINSAEFSKLEQRFTQACGQLPHFEHA